MLMFICGSLDKSLHVEGNVVVVISHTFKILPPIKQGDSFIENFKWDSKKKKAGSWEHFWNQYGMNTISYSDYENLLINANCVPEGGSVVVNEEVDITEEEVEELEQIGASGFNVYFDENGPTNNRKEKKCSGVGKKIDFDKVQNAKNKTGALGEGIVMDILSKAAEADGCKEPIHVSKVEGDGLGYDIRAFDKDGKEIHIEVKATKSNYPDGFEMSYNEVAASLDPNYLYFIYRVYGLNTKTKACRIKVHKGPVTVDNFKLVSTKVAVYQK